MKEATEKNEEGQKKNVFREIVFYCLLVIFCVYIVPAYLLQRTKVDGHSMEPSLMDGESLLIEKISPRIGKLKRFDIIVFSPYGTEEKEHYVKRIIGLPGETVQILEGKIWINGSLLEENYGKSEIIRYAGIAADEIVLGEDEYFVLGDNRERSTDSRYTRVGKVRRENINGKVLFRIFPLSRFGRVK